MRLLGFDIRRNLKKPPKIHVKSATTGAIYGSFQADEPEKFEGWPLMNEAETIELKHYMDNLKAVKLHFGEQALEKQSDYRMRLPLNFIEAVEEISILCHQAEVKFDIFEPMVTAIIQQIKIAVVKLKDSQKATALTVLDKLGLAEYKKLDYSQKIQAIFSEYLSINNKSEKLHKQAVALFNKDKSFSRKTIENMATGETTPSRWLVACAVVVLAEEKPKILRTILSDDDLFMLLVKPMLDNNQKEKLLPLLKKFKWEFLMEKDRAITP